MLVSWPRWEATTRNIRNKSIQRNLVSNPPALLAAAEATLARLKTIPVQQERTLNTAGGKVGIVRKP